MRAPKTILKKEERKEKPSAQAWSEGAKWLKARSGWWKPAVSPKAPDYGAPNGFTGPKADNEGKEAGHHKENTTSKRDTTSLPTT